MELTDTRRYAIQMMRGLAIIAVVFIHNTPDGVTQVFCRPFFNFSVGLFLFLSGMLSNARRWNPKKRILKVLIPYIIWTLVYVIFSEYRHPQNIPFLYLKNFVTGRAAGMMYYVFVYCELTLLIPIIDKIARSKYRYWAFLISPVEIIIMRLLPLILGLGMNKYIAVIQNLSCLGWFTYYYLGYMIGNSIIELKSPVRKLFSWWVIAIILQMLEGYFYLLMGESNCGTQLKLTAILSGSLFTMLSYKFINLNKIKRIKILYLLGNASFGIYFSHIAIMQVLRSIPYYSKYIIYPLNALVVVFVSYICVIIGKSILGKYSKYLAL